MEDLTLLFALLAMGLFLLNCYKRSQGSIWLGLFVAMFSLAAALTDVSLKDQSLYLSAVIILDVFVAFYGLTWILYPDSERRRRRWEGAARRI